jgi:hypothetical protein
MPVPIPGSKVGSDNQKVQFLTIFGRPKTWIFREFRGVLGRAPLAINRAAFGLRLQRSWHSETPCVPERARAHARAVQNDSPRLVGEATG